MPDLRHAFVLFVLLRLSSGCATTHARPMAGPATPLRGELGYFIATDGEEWVVRVHTNERSHRFQGSVTAVRGALRDLALDRPQLAEQVAMQDGAVQFDLDVPRGSEAGFRVRATHDGGCARFDLYVDGARRPERVYLGRRKRSPVEVPFERCR